MEANSMKMPVSIIVVQLQGKIIKRKYGSYVCVCQKNVTMSHLLEIMRGRGGAGSEEG